MFVRKLTEKIISYADKYPAIALVGPRQSGKTTLARQCFGDYLYVSLENPDTRLHAVEDPRGFLSAIETSTILDEIQYVPELLSYLQEILDDANDRRHFVLTGSNSFTLSNKIAQSLAGRTRILNILPLSFAELSRQGDVNADNLIWSGLYPAIHDRQIHPTDWLADYYQTYVQKDVRTILGIKDLQQFDRFLRVLAGHSGQLSNYSRIAEQIGISHSTATQWGSVLEASFLTFRLQPHHNNFKKRMIKSPKIYFLDSGLLCYLLRIRSPQQLALHPLYGHIYENWIVSECYKYYANRAEDSPLYFWRDQHGHEIDLIVDIGGTLHPVEIKSGQTFRSDWLKQIMWFNTLRDGSSGSLVYGGDRSFEFKAYDISSWCAVEMMLDSIHRG